MKPVINYNLVQNVVLNRKHRILNPKRVPKRIINSKNLVGSILWSLKLCEVSIFNLVISFFSSLLFAWTSLDFGQLLMELFSARIALPFFFVSPFLLRSTSGHILLVFFGFARSVRKFARGRRARRVKFSHNCFRSYCWIIPGDQGAR